MSAKDRFEDQKCHIDKLPNELLSAVFSTGSGSATLYDELSFPMVVSTVSSLWRQIAVNTPPLWTSVLVNFWKKNTFSCNIPLFIERSKMQPLSFNIHFSDPPFNSHSYRDLSDAIAKNTHRIHEIIVCVESLSRFHDFASPFNALSFPILTRLEIDSIGHHGLSDHVHLFTGAKHIRSVVFPRCPECAPLGAGLTHLEIRNLTCNVKQLGAVFQASPSLHTLTIYKFGTWFLQEPGFRPIVANSLHTLNVNINFDEKRQFFSGETCGCPLTYLVTPNLINLAGDAFWIQQLSTLTHIELIDTYHTHLWNNSEADSSSDPWRNLTTVTMDKPSLHVDRAQLVMAICRSYTQFPRTITFNIIDWEREDLEKLQSEPANSEWNWTATAVAHAKEGRGLIRINGSPINLVQPEILRMKVYEPILVAGEDSFGVLDIRVRVKGGGHTSQVYAIRQAIAKALVAYYTKYIDAYSALELKKKLVAYDRTLLIADPRRMEPKKFGGAGARARRQKRALVLMDSPCASQFQEIPQIFTNEASPWRIFVSANGITGRPKLVRTLKKAGAVICSDPKQANVILVDATSDTGREFIREWGGDTDKVVLQHTWVAACLAASKVLAKDDEWGGFLTLDDGLPIAKEGTISAEDTVNPLPTPRITPMEVSSSASGQSAPTPVPNTPSVSQPSLQDAVSNDSLHTYPQNNAFTSQQMYQQAFAIMAQMQQQTFAQPNLMSFQNPYSGSNGPLTPYSAGMGSFNYDMYNMHPLYATLNRNMMFTQDPPNPSTPSNPAEFNSSTVPPSFRRKSPILPRSTPTSHSSGEQMRSISPTSISAPVFSQSVSQRTPNNSSLPGALFKNKDGHELSFFVQVDLNNRSRTVTAIKKNGGKIVSNNKTADYAILYSQSKTFDLLLESTILAGRPAVSAAFVQDCVDRNELLNTSSYEFETAKGKSATPRGKRKRIKSEEEEEHEMFISKRLAISEGEVSPLKTVKTAKVASPARQITQQRPPFQPDDPSWPRSPSPPAENTRVKRRGSEGFMYSEHEREYAKRYVKVLLQRDHQISNSAIGKALHQKVNCPSCLRLSSSLILAGQMDNHSVASWRAFLTQEPFRSVLDGARKTAGIEFRKQHARAELLAREVETVARFFATGAGRSGPDEEDDGNDAVAWERLTQQTKCQSCASWTDWYSDHHAEVEKRYQELLAST
ncbi:hypothetical protein C0992_006527 [Termitomyces sp. T32_za158]|nr:hypothetical protein C0992_006527 [Termitomyces sp. T32_za158]